MGARIPFKKVILFTGIIFTDRKILESVKKELIKKFSKIDIESEIIDFNFTSYYFSEMGSPLFRQFVSFNELLDPELLPEIKKFTNSMEEKFSKNGKRLVNLDPGYISDANVIIATTKNHYHRVPLSDGIYAHIEYVFKAKRIKCLEWTYPDFKSDEYKEFFLKSFLRYKELIKK